LPMRKRSTLLFCTSTLPLRVMLLGPPVTM
jgi:hypothetical protein